MKMNFTTPLEMPGDTLGCQIKKLGIAELKHSTRGFPRKMKHEKHLVEEGKQLNCGAQIWGRREEKRGEGTAVLERNC